MSPQQEKKLKRLAKVLDGGDVELLTQLDRVENALESKIEGIERQIPALRQAEDGKVGAKGDKGESIKGDKGERGERGEQGDSVTGKTGAKGEKGEKGESVKGDTGKDGADGFVDDATVGYLEAQQDKLFKSVAKINSEKSDGIGLVVRELRAGSNITIDNTNQEYPIITGANPDEIEW